MFFPIHLVLVLGTVSPEELGVTLPHEHLFLDFRAALTKPTYGPDLPQNIQFSLPNLGSIQLYPYVFFFLIVQNCMQLGCGVWDVGTRVR